jgi:hypothetical protein
MRTVFVEKLHTLILTKNRENDDSLIVGTNCASHRSKVTVDFLLQEKFTRSVTSRM